ncbi:MAG: DNA repair protein RadA [Patescibacteria group bacterium]
MKLKTVFVCQTCTYQSTKWIGKCPECNNWNTFQEDVVNIGKADPISKNRHLLSNSKPVSLLDVNEDHARIETGIHELDHILGGGIVEGSVILLSGEPGIGKSTLTMQVCGALGKKNKKVLYVSGEESVNQLAARAKRLGVEPQNIQLFCENNLERIMDVIRNQKPDFVILDSIQVIQSSDIESLAGSISQVRFCAEVLTQTAKSQNIPLLLIGHVTKEGTLAGPRVLEHLVDAVLHLEGERFHQMRILRSNKNRYGSTNEVGVFEMNEKGLQEVTNPSKLFLDGRSPDAIGSVITCTLEGTRPLLVEVQALTSITAFGYPKRSSNGFDTNRLQMIIAVLQEHGKLNLANQDIFVNIVGGMKIEEPSGDLAVALAIASSFTKKPFPEKTVAFGEIGLSGELRNVPQTEKRIKESQKLGFEKLVTPKEKKTLREALKG